MKDLVRDIIFIASGIGAVATLILAIPFTVCVMLMEQLGRGNRSQRTNYFRALGQFKYRALRLGGYIAIFNTAILVVEFGWRWWYILALLGFVLLYFFEKKHGIPAEQDIGWRSSSEWQEFKLKDEQFKDEVRKWMTM